MNGQQPKQIPIIAENEIITGRYMNAMQISHTPEEFILDFYFVHPPKGALVSRLITNPSHMKRIATAIQENLRKYEENVAKIQPSEGKEADIGFQAQK